MTDLKSTRDAYGEVLIELGKDNEDIVVLDADLAVSTQTSKFAEKFPERFFDVGCAEQNLIGTAAGLAAGGKIPFASTYAIFATGRAWEQIRSVIAHDRLNVKIVASHAGLTNSPDGASHQSLEDIALMRVIPNMTVIVPADAIEAKKAINAVVEYYGPVYIRLNRVKTPVIFDHNYNFSIYKAVTLTEGEDLGIIATGSMVANALQAADLLKKREITARVINMHTIKPIDKEIILRAARETGAIVTVEEHSINGGLGSAVAEILTEEMPVPMRRVGVKDRFGQSGRYEELLKEYGLNAGHIAKVAEDLFNKKDGG